MLPIIKLVLSCVQYTSQYCCCCCCNGVVSLQAHYRPRATQQTLSSPLRFHLTRTSNTGSRGAWPYCVPSITRESIISTGQSLHHTNPCFFSIYPGGIQLQSLTTCLPLLTVTFLSMFVTGIKKKRRKNKCICHNQQRCNIACTWTFLTYDIVCGINGYKSLCVKPGFTLRMVTD